MTSLGNMVGYGREYLTRAPWIMLCPAATIVLTTLAISVIGDWLRDRLESDLEVKPIRPHTSAACLLAFMGFAE